MSWFYNMFGGDPTYTEAECRAWLANKNINPRSGRVIGPTKTGKGPFYDLHAACEEKGIAAPGKATTTPAPKPIKTTSAGEKIIRTTVGRKAPNVSATSVEVGTKMMGNDGLQYIVKMRANGTQYWQPCAQKTANC
jgi:hypothetical protein